VNGVFTFFSLLIDGNINEFPSVLKTTAFGKFAIWGACGNVCFTYHLADELTPAGGELE
jgi:hypothetical protein